MQAWHSWCDARNLSPYRDPGSADGCLLNPIDGRFNFTIARKYILTKCVAVHKFVGIYDIADVVVMVKYMT